MRLISNFQYKKKLNAIVSREREHGNVCVWNSMFYLFVKIRLKVNKIKINWIFHYLFVVHAQTSD